MKERIKISSMIGQLGYLQIGLIGILILLMITLSSSAATPRNRSSLELKVWNGGNFEMKIDGRYIQHGTAAITNIEPGRYKIEVVQRRGNAYGHGGGGVITLFDGYLRIPERTALKVLVQRNKTLRILEKRSLVAAWGNEYAHQPVQQQQCGGTSWHSDDVCLPAQSNACNQCEQNCSGICQQSEWGWQNDEELWNNNQGHDLVIHGPAIMSNQDYQQLRTILIENNFDDQRFVIASQALDRQLITTEQVIGLLRNFNFESTRLEFAKFAYARTIDPQRFYLVYDEFSFSSSINELQEFISSN